MRLARAAVLLAPMTMWAGHPCLPCHEPEVRAHLGSSHARSLRPVVETEFYRALPEGPIVEARGGFDLTYERLGQGLVVTAARRGERISALISWAFGAGVQGVTPVAPLEGRYLEHRISYYPRAAKFDLTLGHQPGVSTNARAALGMVQAPETIRKCFGCHATDVSPDLASFQPGVQCERCHAGARQHASGGPPPANPGRLSPHQLVSFCAACHRAAPPSGNAADPLNIRFQPYRLTMSRCYAGGKLTCLTCHDPHANARENAAFYQSRCVECHRQPHTRANCLPCHMPRSSPTPYLAFTDHRIRRPHGPRGGPTEAGRQP